MLVALIGASPVFVLALFAFTSSEDSSPSLSLFCSSTIWLLFAYTFVDVYRSRRQTLLTSAEALKHVESVLEYCAARKEHAERELARREVLEGLSPCEFEFALAKVLEHDGYRGVKMGPGVGDFGADVLVEKGGRSFVVQVKQWANPVQRQELQKLQGAMVHFRADGGIFVTLGRFSSGAVEYGREHGLELIDGDRLVEMAGGDESWVLDGRRHLLNEVASGECGHRLRVWVQGSRKRSGRDASVTYDLDLEAERCSACRAMSKKVVSALRVSLEPYGRVQADGSSEIRSRMGDGGA